MRSSKSVKIKYRDPSIPAASAQVYEFDAVLTRNQRRRRLKTLEQENAMLASVMSQTRIEIVRLRKLLMEP
ncbi:hypothetical protein [Rhodopseudomonas palustris]|uniref:hypothetical protein n=1 Tax=Rhodopseudomonas palustris TaxID=1076 RepID=UPI0005A1F7D1